MRDVDVRSLRSCLNSFVRYKYFQEKMHERWRFKRRKLLVKHFPNCWHSSQFYHWVSRKCHLGFVCNFFMSYYIEGYKKKKCKKKIAYAICIRFLTSNLCRKTNSKCRFCFIHWSSMTCRESLFMWLVFGCLQYLWH